MNMETQKHTKHTKNSETNDDDDEIYQTKFLFDDVRNTFFAVCFSSFLKLTYVVHSYMKTVRE